MLRSNIENSVTVMGTPVPVKAVHSGTVMRLTVDLNQGTYQRLDELLNLHNTGRHDNEKHVSKAQLMRGLLGSWMYTQTRIQARTEPVDSRWRL